MNHKAQVNSLFEDGWFFGNSLATNKARSTSKMVRCFSDPCPCSTSKEDKDDILIVSFQNPSSSTTSSLLRTPSLPPSWGRETKYCQEEEDEEEDEPSMGDLIRQAMPLPMPSCRRLDRAPSLPPCRTKGNQGPISIQNGPNGVGKLSRRASIDTSSVLLPENGPIGLPKLSRRASIDSSTVLPPKYTSKATKQSNSNSKNRQQRKPDVPNINGSTGSQYLDHIKSQKSLSNLQIEELQSFKELGLSFHKKHVNPSVLPTLQRKGSIDSSITDNGNKVRKPRILEALQRQFSSPLLAPPVFTKGDQKAPSAEDMKAQIKFWARAVASNVRQEC